MISPRERRGGPTPPAPLPEGKGVMARNASSGSPKISEFRRSFSPFPSGWGAGGVGPGAETKFPFSTPSARPASLTASQVPPEVGSVGRIATRFPNGCVRGGRAAARVRDSSRLNASRTPFGGTGMMVSVHTIGLGRVPVGLIVGTVEGTGRDQPARPARSVTITGTNVVWLIVGAPSWLHGFSGDMFSIHPLTLGSIQLKSIMPGTTPSRIARITSGSRHAASRGVSSGKACVAGFVPR